MAADAPDRARLPLTQELTPLDHCKLTALAEIAKLIFHKKVSNDQLLDSAHAKLDALLRSLAPKAQKTKAAQVPTQAAHQASPDEQTPAETAQGVRAESPQRQQVTPEFLLLDQLNSDFRKIMNCTNQAAVHQ